MTEFMTDSQILEQRITDALATIRREWDHMLPVGPAPIRYGIGRQAQIMADDHADTGADIDAGTRLVSLRRDAADPGRQRGRRRAGRVAAGGRRRDHPGGQRMSDTQTCPECEKPLPEDAFVCRECVHTARRRLLGIAFLLPHADAKRARIGTNWAPGTIGRSSEKPLPFDPRVTDTVRPFVNWLIGVARIIEDQSGDVWPADEVALTLWVRERVMWASRQDWALDVIQGVRRSHARFSRVFDIPPEAYAIGQCHAELEGGGLCKEYLSAPEREGIHTCPKCGAQHDVAARRSDLLEQSGDLHVTAEEASKLLRFDGMDIDPRTVRAVIKQVRIQEGGTRPLMDIKGRRRSVSAYPLSSIREAVVLMGQDEDMRREVNRIKRGSSARTVNV